jgi:hypothetical protein
VLAPQIVSPDPAAALAKVRAVPRGRVPTFLVGDAEDEPRMKDLADGFLARPLSTSDLVSRVRARLGKGPATGERRIVTGEHAVPSPNPGSDSGEFSKPGGSKSGPGGRQVRRRRARAVNARCPRSSRSSPPSTRRCLA